MFVFSFAAGTTDGPGEFDFTQGANTTNPFWDFVSGLLKDPSPEQEACHAPKPILLDTGEVSTVHIVFLKAPCYVNSQNSAISLKHNHSIDEIKLILDLQVKNSITHLTMTYSPKPIVSEIRVKPGIGVKLKIYFFYRCSFRIDGILTL